MKVLAITAVVSGVALLLLVASSRSSNDNAYDDKDWSPRRRLGAQNLFESSNNEVKYIVTFEDRLESPRVRCAVLAKAKGGKVSRIHNEVNACSIIMPRAQTTVGAQAQADVSILGELTVKIFEEDGEAHAVYDDNDFTEESNSSPPIFARERRTQQVSVSTSLWGLDRINQCSATRDGWATPQNATGVHVFIIDSGIRGTHDQFDGMMGPTDCHFSAYSTTRADALTDGNGHGTHCAGTVCGKTYGVASKTKPILCAVKVLDSTGSGSWDAVISGINHVVKYCTDSSIRRCVVNMSIGGAKSDTVNNAVTTAVGKGVVMVVAAGNDNKDACKYSPASSINAITVGSTTSSDAKSSFSNFCTTTSCCVDIFAPGSSVLSAWSTSNIATNTISGTSMASPHVAGIAVGILANSITLTPAQVRDMIVNRASTISSTIKLATVTDCSVGATTKPTSKPSTSPSSKTSTSNPISNPTTSPSTKTPSSKPTPSSLSPTSASPTSDPSSSVVPTTSIVPSMSPTDTVTPSSTPSLSPSSTPTFKPTTVTPSSLPTTSIPTSKVPTTKAPTSSRPTSSNPTSSNPTSSNPTSSRPTSSRPTSSRPTTSKPSTLRPTSSRPTTSNSISVDGVTIAGNYIAGSAQVYASGVLILGGLCNATSSRSSYSGMVVLCLRGNGTYASKTLNVQSSGGVAIVIYNNVAGDFQGDLVTTSTIPAISISKAFGEYLMKDKADRGLVAKVTAKRI